MRRLDWLLSLSCVCALAGCGDDGGAPVDAAPGAIDAASVIPDAGPLDAGLCAGQALFTGAYVDWDGNSTGPTNTLDTLVSQDDDPANSTSISAPNGRVVMCLPADQATVVTFTHPDYLPLRYTFDPAAAGTAFDIVGLTEARIDELFTLAGLTRDPLLAQVMVYLRMETASPEAVGAPVTGARVVLGNGSAPPHIEADGAFVSGDVLVDGTFVLYPNAELTGGATTVTVTPPQGVTCAGPDSIALGSGELVVTTFTCTGP